MSPIEFCYWLQGWVELENGKTPKPEQWKMILEHLDLVFKKVTPPLENTDANKDDNLIFEGDLPLRIKEEDKEFEKTLKDALQELPLPGIEVPACQSTMKEMELICSHESDPSYMEFCSSSSNSVPPKGRDD